MGRGRDWENTRILRLLQTLSIYGDPQHFDDNTHKLRLWDGTHVKDFDGIQLRLSVKAKEPWGRIKAPGCVSAANVFKVLPSIIIMTVRIVSEMFPRLPGQAMAWSYPAVTIFLTSGNLKWISCFIVPNCGRYLRPTKSPHDNNFQVRGDAQARPVPCLSDAGLGHFPEIRR